MPYKFVFFGFVVLVTTQILFDQVENCHRKGSLATGLGFIFCHIFFGFGTIFDIFYERRRRISSYFYESWRGISSYFCDLLLRISSYFYIFFQGLPIGHAFVWNLRECNLMAPGNGFSWYACARGCSMRRGAT